MAINKKHIDNVFGQKFSLFDFKKVKNYFEDQKLNEETRHVVKEQWDSFDANSETKQDNLDHVFHKLHYTITNNESSNTRVRLLSRLTQIAAILVVGLFIAASIFYTQKNDFAANTSEIEFISQTGFRNQFKLPDGTVGWLGYGSVLKYRLSDDDKRIVDLNGLAFFNVSHNDKLPFVVKTPTDLSIQVLGTRFNVSSYSETNSCEIVLEEGSVSLNLNDQDVDKMIPNERVIFNAHNNSFEKSKVDVDDFLAWTNGRLVLNDVSLEEACVKLSRFYNVNFDLHTKNIDDQRIRLVLEDESLEDVLKLLTTLVPVKYHISEREILNNNSYSKKTIILKNR